MEFVVIPLLYYVVLGASCMHENIVTLVTSIQHNAIAGRRTGVHINESCSMQRSMSEFCQCYYD